MDQELTQPGRVISDLGGYLPVLGQFSAAGCMDYEEILPPPDYEETYTPLAVVLPENVTREILARITKDPDILINFCMGLIERDEVAPSPDYLFQLPEEVKQIVLRGRVRQKKS